MSDTYDAILEIESRLESPLVILKLSDDAIETIRNSSPGFTPELSVRLVGDQTSTFFPKAYDDEDEPDVGTVRLSVTRAAENELNNETALVEDSD